MNLQTEALAKQAAEYAIEFATQDQALYIPKLMEKFAELIVREVFAKIEGERFEIYQPVKESVMKHFGVEE